MSTASGSRARAFTLVEVMVAVFLLSVTALGVAATMVSAQHGRGVSERSLRATQLAIEGIEQLRAGQALDNRGLPSGFDRSGTVTAWENHPGLARLEVSVSWSDDRPRTFELVTLVQR